MTQSERLKLIRELNTVVDAIHHTVWPSGICADECKGCNLQRTATNLLKVLKRDITSEQAPPATVAKRKKACAACTADSPQGKIDRLLVQIKQASLIVRIGKDEKGNSYNDIGKMNQACWIGEHIEPLLQELTRLRQENDKCTSALKSVHELLLYVYETQNLINAGEAMALVCDKLIREFHRNPMQPDLGMIVTNADRALARWHETRLKVPAEQPSRSSPEVS